MLLFGRKHCLPLDAKVSFKGDCRVYEVADYQTVLECSPGCEIDHDCFPEPHICVSHTIFSSMPLSQLKTVFDERGYGRNPTPEERKARTGARHENH